MCLQELPDDAIRIHGFGEAALIKVIRRRFLESYKIYTYVDDILLVLNPYIKLKENVVMEDKLWEVSRLR